MIRSLESVTNDSELPEAYDELESNDEPESDDEPEHTHQNPVCVVCLQERSQTWIFLPCRHVNCCGSCNETLEEQEQSCPTCRSLIEQRFQIYTN